MMKKQVILITGTPSVGKTSIALALTEKIDSLYLNLSCLALSFDLSKGFDIERKTTIINEKKMREKIQELIDSTSKTTILVDGHYAASVVPKEKVTKAFVFRRNPIELKKLMEKRKFKGNKLWENLESEILDVCLIETLSELEENKVCELDISGKTIEEVIHLMISIINNHKQCSIGNVDWLDMLEKNGLLDEYLKK